MKKWLAGAALAASALVSMAGVAQAEVTVDWKESTGFVGKGDVQAAYGWNNAQMQRHQEQVGFAVVRTSVVAYECGGSTSEHTLVEEQDVQHVLAYEQVASNRKNKNGALTGFRLVEQGEIFVDVDALPCSAGEPQNPEVVEERHQLYSHLGDHDSLRLLHEEQTIGAEVSESPVEVGGA